LFASPFNQGQQNKFFMIDKIIAKTLLLAPTKRKWTEYQTHFRDFFAGRWERFDEFIAFITEFCDQHGDLPGYQNYEQELTAINAHLLLEYVRAIAGDDAVPIYDTDVDFLSCLRTQRVDGFRGDLNDAILGLQQFMQRPTATDLTDLQTELDATLTKLYAAQQRILVDDAPTTVFFAEPPPPTRVPPAPPGLSAVRQTMYNYYAAIEAKRDDEALYALPWTTFKDVQIKPGNLVFVGAYSSQGKSLLLRALAYHFLVAEARNVAFFTLEMTGEAAATAFALMHANNKTLFPYTSRVPVAAYKEGRLRNEQFDFYIDIAIRDLESSPDQGMLWVEQPKTAAFSLADLAQRLKAIQSRMPVHVLVIDYITYMSPVPSGRFVPARIDDFNLMIKELKRLCLTHRGPGGASAPLICFTAAQVSRRAYGEALKSIEAADRDGSGVSKSHYDLQAFSTYTEIERSADIALTALMTPEMRRVGQMMLQVQKNRDGVVPPDPLTLYLDFEYGTFPQELSVRTREETIELMRNLKPYAT
jgi:hypothetical protein